MKKLIYSICLMFATGGIAQTTWLEVATPTTKNLNCIVFASPEVGYIGGKDSVLLKTVDGGLTWNELSYSGITFLPGGNDFLELDFISDEIGFATVGPYSGIYKTIDGGLTWTLLNSSGSLCFNHGLYFFPDGDGFVGGAGCFQGEQMDKFTSDVSAAVVINTPTFITSDMIVDIDFDLDLFATVGLAVSAGGRILRTTDGGFNWDTLSSPLGIHVPLTSVTIVNSSLAYVGYDDGSGIGGLLMSIDGGLTWSFDTNTSSFYYPIFHDVHTTSLDRIYSGSTSTTLNSGLILESNGSDFWNMYPVDEPIFSMTSISDTIIWGAGKNGYLVRSINAGELSVDSESLEGKVELFPNPANDFFTVNFSDQDESNDFFIEVFSMDGKMVKNSNQGVNTVQISDLNSGNYIVKVRKGSLLWTTKFTKS
jgi:hypothetical protein